MKSHRCTSTVTTCIVYCIHVLTFDNSRCLTFDVLSLWQYTVLWSKHKFILELFCLKSVIFGAIFLKINIILFDHFLGIIWSFCPIMINDIYVTVEADNQKIADMQYLSK